ncbi:barstar family protein [Acidovorax sp. BLS4]|uniref:barstar family protein n=1 Tax=Acidovorax sp. BLS4 TaxID=3273430 RepID=UPI0029426633|nr:barstar family protein [Paracidovorax avenae]WOI45053.1 barstar family protein [Paracidovorax avenae]
MNKVVQVDLRSLKEVADLHDVLANAFGFPDFYGKNFNALIDCWGSLRTPEDAMTTISVKDDEYIVLMVKGLSDSAKEIFRGLISAVEFVNAREYSLNKSPVIYIVPVG